MDTGLIPQRYAKALYKVAVEHNDTRAMYDIAKNVIEAFTRNPELQKVLSNPFVNGEDKEKLLLSAAGDLANEDYKRFLKLIIDNKRVDFAHQMMLAYRDIYRKENHISQVHISTASKFHAHQMKRLRQLVEDAFPSSTLEFSESVNPDLIGGFVIDVDAVRLDASISNELEQLRQTLLKS